MRRFTFWAVALAVLVIVVFNVQGWLVLNRTSRAFEQELGDRLQSVATTLSATLGPDFDTPRGRRVLGEVMRGNRLFNLFIVSEDLEYVVNLGSPELEGTVDPALQLDMTEILTALSGAPAQSQLYEAGGFHLKTAYAGLPREEGTISAVLGVEADAQFYSVLTGFRDALVLINVLSLVAMVAIVLVSVSLARHALRVEQAAARANTLALMGQMSVAVAHEIKNPLAIIRSSAERLKKRYGAGADDPAFDYIPEEVDRLSQVVSNYLGIGKSRPGETEPVDVAAVLRDVATDLDGQARKRGVELAADVPDLPEVNGNRNELRQVFLNLVLNAIQAQPDGGRVLLAARVEKSRGESVVVTVRDEGPGIDPKTAKRVFEPFYTTKEKGSGLGLFVVKRIVEEHRGRVKLDTKPGAGTTFEVRLPA